MSMDEHGRAPAVRWRLMGVLLLGLILSVSPATAADKIAASLVVPDALTRPGKPARIEARLVREGLIAETVLGGEVLELAIGKRKVARAMTGGDGRAFFEWTPTMRGIQPITVRVADSRRVVGAEADAVLASWERRRPILLVESATLVEEGPPSRGPIPSLPLPGSRSAAPNPAPDAAEVLKQLTQFFYNVIYLVRSEGPEAAHWADHGDIRPWLKAHRFPQGLTRVIKPGRAGLEAFLQELREGGWDNLKAGIGRTREFAELLVEQRVQVVIVPEPERGDLPRKAKTASNWKGVRGNL